MNSVGWNLTQRSLKYSIITNRGKKVYPGMCEALRNCYTKMAVDRLVILTDFYMEIFDNDTTQIFWNISMKNARKLPFTGFWVNISERPSVIPAETNRNPCQRSMVLAENLELWSTQHLHDSVWWYHKQWLIDMVGTFQLRFHGNHMF